VKLSKAQKISLLFVLQIYKLFSLTKKKQKFSIRDLLKFSKGNLIISKIKISNK